MAEKHGAEELGLRSVIRRARNHLAKALEAIERVESGDRDEAIHEIRKRIKKVRALICLMRGPIGRKSVQKVERGLREAARPLSAIRDSEALLRTFADLADRQESETAPDLIAEVRLALQSHKDQLTSEGLGEGQALAPLAKTIRSTRRRLAKWDHSSTRDLDFRRAYRQSRAASQTAFEDPSPETLHEFRKQVKVLEYQLATVVASPAGPVARIRRLAGLLADELGQVHDLDVLREFVVRTQDTSPLLGQIDRRRLGLRHDALRRAGVVFLEKPRVFEKMVKAESKAEALTSET